MVSGGRYTGQQIVDNSESSKLMSKTKLQNLAKDIDPASILEDDVIDTGVWLCCFPKSFIEYLLFDLEKPAGFNNKKCRFLNRTINSKRG